MANDFTLSVGQAHELEMAMRRAGGWNPALVKRLSTGNNFTWVRDVLNGTWEAKEANHAIDCSVDPFIPDGWRVECQLTLSGKLNLTRVGDDLFLDGRRIVLHLSPNQVEGKFVNGYKLRMELAALPNRLLPAHLLDYLLAHPELIPESWKDKAICFWGTIYRGSDGLLNVRYLHWDGGGWDWSDRWLDLEWVSDDPAAVLAS